MRAGSLLVSRGPSAVLFPHMQLLLVPGPRAQMVRAAAGRTPAPREADDFERDAASGRMVIKVGGARPEVWLAGRCRKERKRAC